MTTKKEILEYTKQNGFVYPKFKIVLYFGLFGGMIGLMTMLIFDFISRIILKDVNLLDNINILSFFEGIFYFAMFSTFFGTVFGFIPALLTGVYCAIFNFIIMKKLDYMHLYIIGTIFSAIYFNFWANLSDDFWQRMYELWKLGSIGGMSAMICGKLFLPKLPKDF